MSELRDRQRMRTARSVSLTIGWLLWMPLWLLSWRWPVFDFFAWLAGFAFATAICIHLATVAYWWLGRRSR